LPRSALYSIVSRYQLSKGLDKHDREIDLLPAVSSFAITFVYLNPPTNKLMTTKPARIRFGIISTGAIASAFARALSSSGSGVLEAVGSRDATKAKEFAAKWGGARPYGSYEELLGDKNVDAVYVATPHPQHVEWAIKAARAGKHVLCEKPLAVNQWQSQAIADACVVNNVKLMEAFMYRTHPQTKRLYELVQSKAIGDLQMIVAPFAFRSGFNAESRLFKNDAAGGGIMDVGCYTVSIANLLAGAAAGKPFDVPTDVKGTALLGPTGVDHVAAATLRYASGVIAQVSTGITLNQDNTLRLFGTAGSITVPNWFLANRERPDQGLIQVHLPGQPVQEVRLEADKTSFGYEIDAFAKLIQTGEAPHPAPSVDDTLGAMDTLDRWRATIGLTYQIEKPESYGSNTLAGAPLKFAARDSIETASIPFLDKPVSKVIFGCDNQASFAHAASVFDDFFELGGNTFDTAHIYGGGQQERLLGAWMKLRGVRNQVCLLGKGAHTPFCNPSDLKRQLDESLTRLQTDHLDIYIMHRDNPAIPVEAFVDVLNELVKAGKIKTFGGSNWSIERFVAANEYAAKSGQQPFSILNNNFSLARMVDPVWGGCIASSDPQSRAFLEKTQTVHLAWSSQARGFFLPGRAHPDKTDDAELTRCWYSPDNFKRLERANELAKKLNVQAINIALAYVLCQPFPSFALIGPRKISETRTSLPALKIKLSREQLMWLNLESDVMPG
jgi:predicted dehydrogenase/aryl-alcohol dehydrogenase-like predicted oxidoreductase